MELRVISIEAACIIHHFKHEVSPPLWDLVGVIDSGLTLEYLLSVLLERRLPRFAKRRKAGQNVVCRLEPRVTLIRTRRKMVPRCIFAYPINFSLHEGGSTTT